MNLAKAVTDRVREQTGAQVSFIDDHWRIYVPRHVFQMLTADGAARLEDRLVRGIRALLGDE